MFIGFPDCGTYMKRNQFEICIEHHGCGISLKSRRRGEALL